MTGDKETCCCSDNKLFDWSLSLLLELNSATDCDNNSCYLHHNVDQQACSTDSIIDQVRAIQRGQFLTLINNNFHREFFTSIFDHHQTSNCQTLEQIINKQLDIQQDDDKQLLILAIVCLSLFVVSNYTGPVIAYQDLFHPGSFQLDVTNYTKLNQQAIKQLAIDGEDIKLSSTNHALLLLIVKIALHKLTINSIQNAEAEGSSNQLQSLCISWWTIRYIRIHQDMLDHNSATLFELFQKHKSLANKQCSVSSMVKQSKHHHDIMNCLLIELSHVSHTYWRNDDQVAHLKQVRDNLAAQNQFEFEITGVFGKRTKFQKQDIAQLILRPTTNQDTTAKPNAADSQQQFSSTMVSEGSAQDDTQLKQLNKYRKSNDKVRSLMPHVISIDNEVLLSQVSLNQDIQSCELSAIEQCFLLAMSESVRHNNPNQHISTLENMLTYLNFILQSTSNQSNWSCQYYALLFRSLLEFDNFHLQNRALLQLEELVKDSNLFHINEASPQHPAHAQFVQTQLPQILSNRLSRFFLVAYPSMCHVKLEIADLFIKLGMSKSALEMYIEINDIEGIIDMYIKLERKAAAQDLIESELIKNPNDPRLLCLLGDVLQDPVQYEESWKQSGQTYPRAQRSLAKHHRLNKSYLLACDSYQLALEINPMIPSEWFALGFCALEIKNFGLAVSAFSRTVQYDSEYADAWNNLAASHLELNHNKEAFYAFEQAVRLNFDSNWKLWENYLITSIKVGEYQKSISAFQRIVTIKSEKIKDIELKIDEDILALLTDLVCHEIEIQQQQQQQKNQQESQDDDKGNQQSITDSTPLPAVHEESVSTTMPNFLADKMTNLLNFISSKITSNACVWQCHAKLELVQGNLNKSIEFQERQVRVHQQNEIYQDSETHCEMFVDAVNQLCDAYMLSEQNRQHQFAAKMLLNQTIAKLKKTSYKSTNEHVEVFKNKLQSLQKKQDSSTVIYKASSNLNLWR